MTDHAHADHAIACPSCGARIPLTSALRAEIETSLKREFEEMLAVREKAAATEAARKAERRLADDMAALREQLEDQAKDLESARNRELVMRRRERELEKAHAELELAVERKLDEERGKLIEAAQQRLTDEHRLKDAEKERQLADMRRQIEDLRRKAEQGSQQLQGEAGEDQLEAVLRAQFPMDAITGIVQGVRGADVHQVVTDLRGGRCGAILWEAKNAKHWAETWIAKLKADQREMHADAAVLVTSALPKGCTRFTLIDGVVVTEFACAGAVAALLRSQLLQLAQARTAATTKEEQLELLYRYLSGVEFRQRVEAMVEAFESMRSDLDTERRAAERQWARRAKQIDAVMFNVSGMYGDLQGLVALPPVGALELPAPDDEPVLVN